MRTLPNEMIWVLTSSFASLFSERVFEHTQVLLAGAILAPGQRIVASVLRAMGLDRHKQFHRYQRVLSWTKWSAVEAGRILLDSLAEAFVAAGEPSVVGIDETPGEEDRPEGNLSRSSSLQPLALREDEAP